MELLNRFKLALTAAIIAGAGCAFASGNNNIKTDPDTVPYKLSIPLFHDELDDEFADEDEEDDDEEFGDGSIVDGIYPSANIYSIWDTYKINPYSADPKLQADSLMLKDEYNCDYVHPFAGQVTSNFGVRKSRFHYGIDIDLETGDSVRSAFEGTVRVARVCNGYGNVVVIRHNNGLETLYGHLSEIWVQPGQKIEAGNILGLGGNTGRSSGSHLHFELRYKGIPINPNQVISFTENSLVAEKLVIDKETFRYIEEYQAYKKTVKAKKKKQKYYVVRKGDTLGKIAKRHRVSTKTLCRLNKIKTTTILRPGRKLRLI